MKKIFGLTLAALLVIGLVGGGTWAYFSDVETSIGNVLAAGTMNLTVDVTDDGGTITGSVTPGADGANEYITFPTNLKPGDDGAISFVVTAAGSVSGNLSISSTVTTGENGDNEPELSANITNNLGGDGDLDEYMGVWLTQSLNGAGATDILGTTSTYAELEDLQAALNAITNLNIPADEYVEYVLYWEIEADIEGAGVDGLFNSGGDDVATDDNIIQSDNATLDITFTLTQIP
ncbi:TasA family protein [Chloroflexota bacterium]